MVIQLNPVMIGRAWRRTADLIVDVRGPNGVPPSDYRFVIRVQAGSDINNAYTIPYRHGDDYLRLSGGSLFASQLSFGRQGSFRLFAIPPRSRGGAVIQGLCHYQLSGRSRRLHLVASQRYEAGSQSQSRSSVYTEQHPSSTGGFDLGIQGSVTVGGDQHATGGDEGSSRETRRGLNWFDIVQR